MAFVPNEEIQAGAASGQQEEEQWNELIGFSAGIGTVIGRNFRYGWNMQLLNRY